MGIKKLKEMVSHKVVLLHASVFSPKVNDIKTDKGSVIEGVGMWLIALVGIGLLILAYQDVITNTIIPAVKANISALFSNITT